MNETITDPRFLGTAVAAAVSIALGLFVLLNPGPFAPTDRIPFALLFLILGVVGASTVRRRLSGSI